MPIQADAADGADTGTGEDDFWASLDEVTSLLQDESYEGSQSSPTLLVAGMGDFTPFTSDSLDLSAYDHDDVFSPLPSTSSTCLESVLAQNTDVTQCQQEIPIPPDILPLLRGSHSSTDEQTVSRVPTPPDITPLLQGALSSANIQLSSASVQPASTTSTAVSSKSTTSRGNVAKKSRLKIGTKSKVIKFHQYLGPKNLQQQLEPCTSTPSTTDASFNILVQQQQMLLRWQLEFQQKNMQFLLSKPSHEPPKPAPAMLAISTPSPQSTPANATLKPSTTVGAVDPALAAKRNRLEEMRVAELRDECRRLNLARSGPKPVLIERLLPYTDDIRNSSNTAVVVSESKQTEQFVTSSSSDGSISTPSVIHNGDMAPGLMFNIQPTARIMAAENPPTSSTNSAVPMDVDSVPCKQEPTTPDISRPSVFPMMLIPTNKGSVVQASVSSAVPPLIVFRPTGQPPAPAELKPIPKIPPSVQEQILLEQQRHINELEHHLQLSQQELVRAQHHAQLQQVLQGDASWMNSAALNGSSMSASMSSVNSRVPETTTAPLHRTNSMLATVSPNAFQNKLRRTMTNPYITTTNPNVVDDLQKKGSSSFAFTVPGGAETLPAVSSRTIDDVLDVLISTGDLPATAADAVRPLQTSQEAATAVSCSSMFFLPHPGCTNTPSAGGLHDNVPSRLLSTSDRCDGMEWYSTDSGRLEQDLPGGHQVDTLNPAELVEFSGLPTKSSIGADLGNIDMSDWLDDFLQPGCAVSSDFINFTDDCDLCSPADGFRATFEKVMEVTTSKS